MKMNVVIIGLNYEYNLNVCNLIADATNLYLLDVNEYINYSLMSRQNMQDVCGIEYLEQQENKVISSCSEFENSVICMPHYYFFRNEVFKKFTNSIIIYLRFSYKKLTEICQNVSKDLSTLPIDLITFDERDNDLTNVSNFKINIVNKKDITIVKEILSKLEGEIL